MIISAPLRRGETYTLIVRCCEGAYAFRAVCVGVKYGDFEFVNDLRDVCPQCGKRAESVWKIAGTAFMKGLHHAV